MTLVPELPNEPQVERVREKFLVKAEVQKKIIHFLFGCARSGGHFGARYVATVVSESSQKRAKPRNRTPQRAQHPKLPGFIFLTDLKSSQLSSDMRFTVVKVWASRFVGR